MDRHYFQNTGAYDPLMSLRGGENLELSLKVRATPPPSKGGPSKGGMPPPAREDPGGLPGAMRLVMAGRQPPEMPLVGAKAVGKL